MRIAECSTATNRNERVNLVYASICICISLRRSFRKPKDSQSTQHRKAFIGIDQVAELSINSNVEMWFGMLIRTR